MCGVGFSYSKKNAKQEQSGRNCSTSIASLPCPAPRVLDFTYRHAAKCSIEQKRKTLQ